MVVRKANRAAWCHRLTRRYLCIVVEEISQKSILNVVFFLCFCMSRQPVLLAIPRHLHCYHVA